ncbi:Neuralized-like protein 2 [Desmophyllum pertusum]|uniref:Neuralized-like protein 2 n=1 Tax=Desmophyllum pertusum TaxID=174260 RepID=A0A9W9Z6M7_9CNID|nr:Neuralized-like protein 2 [Desmophyllum pertusum]
MAAIIFQRQTAGDKDNNPVFCGRKAREGELRPTDVGSRIGVKVSFTGELYFFVNGMKFGPCAIDVPIDKDLFVAVDVYGTTKKVQIIQCGVPSLLDLCCEKIRKRVTKKEDMEMLPIPASLKNYIATF